MNDLLTPSVDWPAVRAEMDADFATANVDVNKWRNPGIGTVSAHIVEDIDMPQDEESLETVLANLKQQGAAFGLDVRTDGWGGHQYAVAYLRRRVTPLVVEHDYDHIEGRYTTWTVVGRELHIELTEEGYRYLSGEDIDDWDAERTFLDLNEYQVCNSHWDMLRPEDIGAMTDSLMFTDQGIQDDSGDWEAIGRVFWLSGYMIHGYTEPMLRDGEVVFTHERDSDPPCTYTVEYTEGGVTQPFRDGITTILGAYEAREAAQEDHPRATVHVRTIYVEEGNA